MLTLAALLLVVGVWLLQRHPGEEWWPTALLTWAPQLQWIVPPALMLVLTIVARRPVLALINLAAALFALIFIADFQMNLQSPAPGDRPVIRVATWNVYGHTDDRETVQQKILSWDADIVCLQEAATGVFEDLLPGYDSVISGPLRTYVRGDILTHESVEIGKLPPRNMLLVEAAIQDERVMVCNVHLPRRIRGPILREKVESLSEHITLAVQERDERIRLLMEKLPPEGPLVLAGDFNTPPGSRYWRMLDRHLTDAFDATGFGFGYSFMPRWTYPLLRIDYVWTDDGASPIRCWTEEQYPSDHRPVLADIMLGGPSTPENSPATGSASHEDQKHRSYQ